MNRREEEIFYNRLKLIRDKAMDKEKINIHSYYYADINIVIVELLEFARYANFNHDKEELFTHEELVDFLEFYAHRKHINCIVTQEQCIDILYLLFRFEL